MPFAKLLFALTFFIPAAPGWWADSVYDPRTFQGRAEYWYQLGKNVQKTRGWEEALNHFTMAIEYDPTHARAYAARALMKCKLNQQSAAMADIEAANYLVGKSSLVKPITANCLTLNRENIFPNDD